MAAAKNYYHKWTQSEVNRLMVLWAQDMDKAKICQELGVSEKALNHFTMRLRRQGIQLKRKAAGNKPGMSSKKWSQADIAFVLREREAGVPVEEISTKLGRTWVAVQAIIMRVKAEGVKIKRFGDGRTRLWDADALKAMSF